MVFKMMLDITYNMGILNQILQTSSNFRIKHINQLVSARFSNLDSGIHSLLRITRRVIHTEG